MGRSRIKALIKPPIREVGGIRIFEEPANEEYQIGIDPSLGATDPCSITCVSKKTGAVVATYTAYVPTNVIAEKAVQMGFDMLLKIRDRMKIGRMGAKRARHQKKCRRQDKTDTG